jgi:hypothetical protein
MNETIRSAMSVLRREAKPFASILVTLAAYAACRALLVLVTGSVGLFSASGSVHLSVAALGALVLGLRLWVLFVVPVLVVFRLAGRAWPP